MSIFPTKILLATDGSEDAQLATTTAVDLAKRLDSELHVVYVGHVLDPGFKSRIRERAEVAAKTKLEEQLQKIKEASGEATQAHARACYELGRKSHRNTDSKIGSVSSWSAFPALLSY